MFTPNMKFLCLTLWLAGLYTDNDSNTNSDINTDADNNRQSMIVYMMVRAFIHPVFPK